jgi:hypothetical protein
VPYGTAVARVTSPGPVVLTIDPTPAARAALVRARKLPVAVHVVFSPTLRPRRPCLGKCYPLGSTSSTKDLRINVSYHPRTRRRSHHHHGHHHHRARKPHRTRRA